MRGADGGQGSGICALPALWVGLLYDSDSLDAAWQIVRDWTDEERQTLRNEVPRTALKTRFRDGTVLDLARQIAALARDGLERRNLLNEENLDETMFLTALEDVVAIGQSPAERLLGEYETLWKSDINEVFRRYAY